MGYRKLALFMLYAFLCQLVFSSSLPHLCPSDQALALRQFKHMFSINPNASHYCFEIQSYPKTLSWNTSTDCCLWDGVHCDETTGQVIEVNLTCSQLQGKIHSNSSLFQLSNLKRLDLSLNDFSGSLISPKFGEFSSLTHLDLSSSSFAGLIPPEISHLSKLYVLRISSEFLRISSEDPYVLKFGPHNFGLLLKNLTQLRELDLNSVSISSTIPLNFSSYLTTLALSNTQLYGILPESVFHLSNLKSLYLSSNPQLTVRFPTTKWNSSASLMYLYLSGVNVDVNDTDLIGLRTLNLSHNNLEGVIPASLQHLSVLESLDLSSNKIGGGIPQQLASLTFLAVLNLSHNHLVGCIPKGKQFDTFENSSYQGNDGLRGFPLSKDCGGDDGVPQATTPVELDEEEGDLSMISWQAVLMGYCCGLIFVLSAIHIMLATQYPAWFSRMVEKLEHRIITRMQKHHKRK